MTAASRNLVGNRPQTGEVQGHDEAGKLPSAHNRDRQHAQLGVHVPEGPEVLESQVGDQQIDPAAGTCSQRQAVPLTTAETANGIKKTVRKNASPLIRSLRSAASRKPMTMHCDM